MEQYQKIDQLIMRGYEYNERNESVKACDVWLAAWEEIKVLMLVDGSQSIDELQNKYEWNDFLSNMLQDLEMELHNAGRNNHEYSHKRITYCSELLKKWGNGDHLVVENLRRAIADSHYALGNKQESARLYEQWLREDPSWGWGYIGYADNYQFAKDASAEELAQAANILQKALTQEELRDRVDVVERVAVLYELLVEQEMIRSKEFEANKSNDNEMELDSKDALETKQKIEALKKKVEAIKKEIEANKKQNEEYRKRAEELKGEQARLMEMVKMSLSQPNKSNPQANKIGRNDPCVCGSGKKYKKCCG